MRRRRVLAIAALALLIAPGQWWRSEVVTDSSHAVRFEPLPAETPESWPEGLTLAQAWHLQPANSEFAGFSALVVDQQGLHAFSDFGREARFARPSQRTSRIEARWLPDSPEIAFTPDVEAAVVDGQRLWLSYEFHNAIRRIDPSGDAFIRPAALHNLGANSGIEAMERFTDGRFLMLSERSQQGFLFAGDPVDGAQATRFRVRWPEDYSPTDTALLPDGRVLVLLRRVTWSFPPFSSMLMVGDPAAIRSGEEWTPKPLATIDQQGIRENYEGLAVEPAEDGALTLWLISDDNRSALQRTLLLKLHWQMPTKTAREGNPREPQNSG